MAEQKKRNQQVSIHEEVVAHPFDGAHALTKVLKEKFDKVNPINTVMHTMFGTVEEPPKSVSLEVEKGAFEQVIWGEFKISGVEGSLWTGYKKKEGKLIFEIQGTVDIRQQKLIKEIAQRVREYIKENSIYKGKALRIKTNEHGRMPSGMDLSFIDVTTVSVSDLLFSDEVKDQIETNILTPIVRTQECRELGIPLKRGILLEGPYGTGKTLTAYVAAQKCKENGWTFIYVDRVHALKDSLLLAEMYGPAVVFAEDIDRTVTGERTMAIDDVLNNLDGVDSKGREVLTILTTNDVMSIEPAMLRPGRLDAIISVQPPDAAAVERLVRKYARGLIEENENLTEIVAQLTGKTPAVIREIVERAKLDALKTTAKSEKLQLTASNLTKAANSMQSHLNLMAKTVNTMNADLPHWSEEFIFELVDALKNGNREVDTNRRDLFNVLLG